MTRRPLTTSAATAVAIVSSSAGVNNVNALMSARSVTFLPPVYQRHTNFSLCARKEVVDKNRSTSNPSSSSSSAVIEQVQPLESVSEERRLNALKTLTKQRLSNGRRKAAKNMNDDESLFAEMDAATMLLDTFTQTPDNEATAATPTKRMSSVPGASSLTLLRQRAAEENIRQRAEEEDRKVMEEFSEEQLAYLIERLDEKIQSGSYEDDDLTDFQLVVDEKKNGEDQRDGAQLTSQLNGTKQKRTKSKNGITVKSKKGRPRKKKTSNEKEVIQKVEPLEQKRQPRDITKSKATQSKSRVTGGSLMNKREKPSTSKMAVSKGSAKIAESLMNSNSLVRGNRRRIVKQLPKSRRDEDGNLAPQESSESVTAKSDSKGNTLSDAVNLNLYYRTELLSAKEEYSCGMKVKFMMKCESVHEGLSNALGRIPTIAEWAAACGFDEFDVAMSSDDYVENDLDREIRPSGAGSNDEPLDPNMFVGNGLVTDSGVGRGKGRVRKPPPNSLGQFYDDSYSKFKDKSQEGEVMTKDDETDIFLYRQKMLPGQPINQGSPRLFREMLLTAKEAKRRMVQCNMRLVVSIARRYHGVGVSVPDLVQEGSLGLSRAAEKFDPQKGFKFSTYASWWIQQAVFRSIAYHSRTIRLPVHVHNLLNKVRRARQMLQAELGRMPSNEEVAAEMDMSVEKYNKMIRSTRNAISLERPKYKNNPKDLGHESEALVGDMVDSAAVIFDEKTPEQNVDHSLFHNDIDFMLGKLGDDERKVLCLRYGIKDGITRTVTLVASEMRQTKSWVRSQECRALRKLRRPWYERRLREHRDSIQSSNNLPL
eukprot:scaffold41942_cov72-Cyclotella_meneghiniana.AAC.17